MKFRFRTLIVSALAALTITSCSPATVDVAPAPYAWDPVCADVLMALPDTFAGAQRRSTNSQASRAWGEDPPIVLRCGVQPPGPTTDRCVGVTDPNTGAEMDFIMDELGGDDQGRGHWIFTTYGRLPAVEVIVPVEHAGDDVTQLLISLTNSLQTLLTERVCL